MKDHGIFCFKTGSLCFLLLILLGFSNPSKAQDIYIGTATADISPKLPVALMGQFHLRVAREAETPLLANIIALETRNETETDFVIFVACDIVVIPPAVLEQTRNEISRRLPGMDVKKVILTATHTHTAPVMDSVLLKYPIPAEGVTQIGEYNDFFASSVAGAVVNAWESRQPGSITWGLSHAVVGHNRRSVYENGTASLYGGLNTPRYRTPEGPEDHDVNTLFLWNKKGKLIGMNINVGCPAQEVEGREAVNADFWHEARLQLKKRFGNDITVVGWVSAAGDQAPRMMFNHKAEERMHKLRNSTRLQELGRRITNAVTDAYDAVKDDRHSQLPLIHKIDTLQLPMRKISGVEYDEARMQDEKLAAQIAADSSKTGQLQAQMLWYRDASKRFEHQYKNPKFDAEIHAIRLGDIVISTNPFEMFTEYGMRIQGRSRAVQTFVVQLAGAGNYLTTDKAVKGGGYSVIMQSSFVGPEGGDIIVDRMVSLINSMWPENN